MRAGKKSPTKIRYPFCEKLRESFTYLFSIHFNPLKVSTKLHPSKTNEGITMFCLPSLTFWRSCYCANFARFCEDRVSDFRFSMPLRPVLVPICSVAKQVVLLHFFKNSILPVSRLIFEIPNLNPYHPMYNDICWKYPTWSELRINYQVSWLVTLVN